MLCTSLAISVSTGPGAMTLTRTPRLPSSTAYCLVMWISAALLVPYATRSVLARKPEIEAMLTMAPWPRWAIHAPKACVQRKAPSRLVASTVRQSSNVVSSTGLNTATPALLTSASTRPRRAITSSAACATCAGSDTSQ